MRKPWPARLHSTGLLALGPSQVFLTEAPSSFLLSPMANLHDDCSKANVLKFLGAPASPSGRVQTISHLLLPTGSKPGTDGSSKVVGKTKLRRTCLWNVDILLLPAVVASRQRQGVIKNALGAVGCCESCLLLVSRSTVYKWDRREYFGCHGSQQWGV